MILLPWPLRKADAPAVFVFYIFAYYSRYFPTKKAFKTRFINLFS